MSEASKWGDLLPRILSAVVLSIVGIGALYLGGIAFQLLIVLLTGVMIWELFSMMTPASRGTEPLQIAALAAAGMAVAIYMPSIVVAPLLIAPVFVAASRKKADRLVFVLYGVLIMAAGYGLVWLREAQGLAWVLWLVMLVIGSDVAGYFAGRVLGGPKFWPRLSPKKTWSGTAAGWAVAALIGLGFGLWFEIGGALLLVSVLLCFVAQLGDIAESAIKRKMQVKDASNLIPGHGGFLDRFDAMLAASAALLLLSLFLGFPPVIG